MFVSAPVFVPGVEFDATVTTERKHNQMMQIALREAGEWYRKMYLPDHFKENAKTTPGGAYGYRKRSEKYMRRKLRKKGHQRPLVYSRRMELKAYNTAKVTARPTSVRLVTRPIYFRTANKIRPELQAIATEESDAVKEFIQFRYGQLLKDPQYQRRRKSRSM